MKVRVNVTVELDAEAWAEEYGIDESEVRKDFQEYAENVIRNLADETPEVGS